MAKKKKTQLKPNPNRGFATTSTPKKAQPEPEAEPEPALLAATSGTQTPSVTQNGEAKAGDGQGGVDGEKSATRHEFDPAQEEEQALQNLVDKLQERVEKEVARAYKAVEFDRRLAKSLPSFDLDLRLRDRILSLPPSTPATSSAAFADPEEKLLLRALTTHGVLRRVGFSRARAHEALSQATAPDLEECLGWLFANVPEEELNEALSGRPSTSQRDVQVGESEGEEDDEDDPIAPPKLDAYEYENYEASSRPQGSGAVTPNVLTTASASASESATPSVTGLSPAPRSPPSELTNGTSSSSAASPNNGAEGGADSDADLKARILALSTRSRSPSPDLALEDPNGTWARARLRIVEIEQTRSRRRKDEKKMGLPADETIEEQEDSETTRCRERMVEAENQRDFDKDEADSAFRAERGRLNAEQQDAEEARGVKTAPNGAAITSPAAAETARPAISTPDAAANEDAASEAGSEGGLFGTMLDELPTSETDASGSIIRIRSLPASKSGAGGKSPRSLLSESLRRIDPFAVTHYAPLGGGSRACRSALTIRWVKQSKRVAVYRMSGEGAPTQNAADDLVATLALNCIERERPVYRALPPGYREWWDELEEARKEERDRKGRDTVRRMKDVLKSRVEEALAKKGKTKATGTPNEGQVQTQVDELVRNVRPVSESVSEELRTKFEEKTQGAAYQKMLVQRGTLPIAKYRDHILEILDSSQIFVLSGETGCGKSTQVPAYVLEHCLSRGQPCKVYVTEPRRISAISLAERVSSELGEPAGAVGGNDSLVGYAIRLESNVGRNARLVYATTGIVLRMLEGTAFNDITHIIIDEVHERSIESDFLLIILKTLTAVRKDLKVILMSATVDAERISAYCGGCPTISVPGRTFPVDVRYLEDAVELTDYTLDDGSQYARRPKRSARPTPNNKAQLKSAEDDDAPNMDSDDEDRTGTNNASAGLSRTYRPKTIATLDKMDEYAINHELIVRLLERVCFSQDLHHYSAATLIFLPGLADIRKCHDLLSDHEVFGGNDFRLYPLHSSITSENQGAVFNIPPPGIRKIVMATNIAETGITIPDITCVIDSGKHREMRFDEKRQISRLVECFIAKSNAKQRRGRAGRVQDGLAFHLCTKARHDQHFADHPLPEMLRLSLQDLALKLKVMKIRIGTSIEDALSQALDPPSALNVQRAVSALVEVKALTTTEDITPLGRHLSRLPLDVHMAKFLLVATLFKCLDPALTIAAALNSKSPFVTPFGREAEADRAKAGFKVADSDLLTIANAFNSWRRASAANYAGQFTSKNFLSPQSLQQIEELRQQYLSYLLDSGFVQLNDEARRELARARYTGRGKARFFRLPADLNAHSQSAAVLHAAAAAGLYPKLLAIDPRSHQLRTLGNNQPAGIHPSSVNFRMKLSELPRGANHLVYFTIMHSRKLYAWETAAVDDRALFLLCGDVDFKFSSNALYIDRNKIRVCISDPKTLVALRALRTQLTQLMNASFRNPGRPWTQEQIDVFKIAAEVLGLGANDRDRALQL